MIKEYSRSRKGTSAEVLAELTFQRIQLREELIQIREEFAMECLAFYEELPPLNELQQELEQHAQNPQSAAYQNAHSRVLRKQLLADQQVTVDQQLNSCYKQQIEDLESLIEDKSKFSLSIKSKLSKQLYEVRSKLKGGITAEYGKGTIEALTTLKQAKATAANASLFAKTSQTSRSKTKVRFSEQKTKRK